MRHLRLSKYPGIPVEDGIRLSASRSMALGVRLGSVALGVRLPSMALGVRLRIRSMALGVLGFVFMGLGFRV